MNIIKTLDGAPTVVVVVLPAVEVVVELLVLLVVGGVSEVTTKVGVATTSPAPVNAVAGMVTVIVSFDVMS